ncbi:hypothetical protein ACOMHN_017719 [Nucella lapillus]
MANQGRNFGLHYACRRKAQEKFDLEAAVAALRWVESVNGRKLGETDVGVLRSEREVAGVLKDGTALCEVMNHIKPGAIKKYHKTPSAFQQMENAELFLRACVEYGMQTIDTFHVKELYESRAVYTVVNCIFSLGSLAQQNGYTGPKLGVKIASRNERQFSEEQMQMARRTVSRQHSVPSDQPSQAHMTPYGLPRQIMLSGTAASQVDKSSHTIIGLQYGSNQVASQSGMTAYGMKRQISASTSSDGDQNTNIIDNSAPASPTAPTPASTHNNPILTTKAPPRQPKAPDSGAVIGLQYGSNRVATQSGMTAYGTPRQIVTSTSSVEENGDGEKGDVF